MKKVLSLVVVGILTLTGCGIKEAKIENAVQINYQRDGITFNFDANTFINTNSKILGENIQNMVDREDYDETELNDTYHIKITSEGMTEHGYLPYDQIKNNKIVYTPKYNEEAYKEIGVKLPEKKEVAVNLEKEKEMLNESIKQYEERITRNNTDIKENQEYINSIKKEHEEDLSIAKDNVKDMQKKISSEYSVWDEDDLKEQEGYVKVLEENPYATNSLGSNDRTEEVKEYEANIKELKSDNELCNKRIEEEKNLIEELK